MFLEALRQSIRSFLQFAEENYIGTKFYDSRYLEEEEFAKVLQSVTELQNPDDRDFLRKVIADSLIATELARYAVREASFALQSGEIRHLTYGILALFLDPDLMDERDVVRSLGVLCDAADHLGIELYGEMIVTRIDGATRSRQKLVKDFFFHPRSVKDVRGLGYERVILNGLNWYRSVGFSAGLPTIIPRREIS